MRRMVSNTRRSSTRSRGDETESDFPAFHWSKGKTNLMLMYSNILLGDINKTFFWANINFQTNTIFHVRRIQSPQRFSGARRKVANWTSDILLSKHLTIFMTRIAVWMLTSGNNDIPTYVSAQIFNSWLSFTSILNKEEIDTIDLYPFNCWIRLQNLRFSKTISIMSPSCSRIVMLQLSQLFHTFPHISEIRLEWVLFHL